MNKNNVTTQELILKVAKIEFLEKGFKCASLRNIVKSIGMTTGAFYGYYKSKEKLFEAIVKPHYDFVIKIFKEAQEEFKNLPEEKQTDNLSEISGDCMFKILYYAYEHLEEFKLILCCSEGTKFDSLIDEMVEIEIRGTDDYLRVLENTKGDVPKIDEHLEHILITGMFNTFFEIIIHEMPLEKAEQYLKQMREFYTAGWMKIMGV